MTAHAIKAIEAFQYNESLIARLRNGNIEIVNESSPPGTEIEHRLNNQTVRLALPAGETELLPENIVKLTFNASHVRHPGDMVDSITSLLPPPEQPVPLLKSWLRKAVREAAITSNGS